MDRSWIYLTLMVAVVGTVGATQCWDCWYHGAAALIGDTDCNKADDLRRVDIKNCTGECFQANGTVAFGAGLWVKRGCMDTCADSDDYELNDLTEHGILRCCTGDFCNNDIFTAASAYAPKASMVVSVVTALGAIFLYRTAL